MEKRIALIEGDGIGPEIMAEAVKVLRCIEELYHHHFTYAPVCAGGCAIDRYVYKRQGQCAGFQPLMAQDRP